MLVVCLRLLVLLPMVCCVPSPSRPPSRICRRCCDHSEPSAATAQYQMPEVRTVINMTILKGSNPGVLSEYCSVKVSWSFCLIFLTLPLQLVLSFKGVTESQQEACLSVFNNVLFVKSSVRTTMVKEKHYFAVVTLATGICPWNSILCPFGKSNYLFRQKFVFSQPNICIFQVLFINSCPHLSHVEEQQLFLKKKTNSKVK